MTPKVVLITGIMAAGKSTVAQGLAERLPRSVHLRGDVFRRMIVNGRVEMTPDQGREQLELRYRLAAMVADEYVGAGFTVVMQDVVLGDHLPMVVDMIRSRPLFVVVLAPSVDVVADREQERAKTGYGVWTPQQLDTALRDQTPRIGLWLDTSNQTPAQTVDEILTALTAL